MSGTFFEPVAPRRPHVATSKGHTACPRERGGQTDSTDSTHQSLPLHEQREQTDSPRWIWNYPTGQTDKTDQQKNRLSTDVAQTSVCEERGLGLKSEPRRRRLDSASSPPSRRGASWRSRVRNHLSANDGFPLELVPACLTWVRCGNDKIGQRLIEAEERSAASIGEKGQRWTT